MKNSRGILWAVLLLGLCALVMIGCYNNIQYSLETMTQADKEAAERMTDQAWPYYSGDAEKNLKSFLRYVYAGSYGMYWELRQKIEQKTINPSELFIPQKVQEVMGEEQYVFDETFAEWYSSFSSLLDQYEVDYRITARDSGESYTNAMENLEQVEEEEDVPFFLKLSFDAEGIVTIEKLLNQDRIVLEAGDVRGMTKERFLDWMDQSTLSTALFSGPVNVDVYLCSDNPDCYYGMEDAQASSVNYNYYQGLIADGICLPYLVLLGVTALLGLIFPPFRRMRRERPVLARIPAEAAAAGLVLGLTGIEFASSLCRDYVYAGSYQQQEFMKFAHFIVYFLLFGSWFLSVLVMCRMFDLGFVRFWKETSIFIRNIGRISGWVKRQWRKFLDNVKTIDLSDRSDRWLLRVVGVNFLILTLCCLVWFWGVLGLMLYSVLLFFFLRKYLDQIKKDYGVLLQATRRMADGNLHMEPTGDLGVFAPLGEELAKVNEGFSRAVEEELRSRNMKTELITNVSHDLKTPLTAIITYVNLLKDEGITEEERRNYIEILDRKSLRLKKLIEDLFEVSKAASGNIRLERQQVDLAEMVRQAVLEQEDRLAEAKIDCRVSVPEERVLIWLDAEKTYRILENLLVNIAKYALPGTRAWVSLEADVDRAVVTVKNISATELDADSSYLTERFVRGDKSRNTEGSGLGLAIAKSFTELQGGSFRIVTDGDLFKAIAEFPREDTAVTVAGA